MFLTVNVSGGSRRALLVAVFCTGHEISRLTAEAISQADLTAHVELRWGLIECGARLLSIATYVLWLYFQNQKRRKRARTLGLSEKESARIWRRLEAQGLSDIENIHFRYHY